MPEKRSPPAYNPAGVPTGAFVETTSFRRTHETTLILALLAGVCVAIQTSLTGAAQRTLGPAVLVAVSGLTTGGCALLISFS